MTEKNQIKAQAGSLVDRSTGVVPGHIKTASYYSPQNHAFMSPLPIVEGLTYELNDLTKFYYQENTPTPAINTTDQLIKILWVLIVICPG